MERCETCKYRDKAGYCTNEKLADESGVDNQDMLIYNANEGGDFWVGPKFGCVHHCAA